MSAEKYSRLGKLAALVSFLLGTAIFGLYFLTSSSNFLFLGYGFVVLAFLVNLGILIVILAKAVKDTNNRSRLFVVGGLMLINIPIMLLYMWAASILLNYMRIAFTNTTGDTITEINITGCSTEHIEELKPKETKTVWVQITGDCTINIDYWKDGQRRAENVMGYVTNSMGQKMKYNIGGRNESEL